MIKLIKRDPYAGKAAIFCLAYVVATVPVFLITWKLVHLAMVWNLFLAVVPLGLALLGIRCLEKEKWIITALLGVLWLLFFPNAPYLVTDFIHMNQMDFYNGNPYGGELVDWLRLVHISLGVLLGSLVGLYSLHLVHGRLAAYWGRARGNAAVAVICLLSGYAIYIGRFLRLNSWDVLRPVHLARTLLANLDGFTLSYSLLFAVFTLCEYLLFRLFFGPERKVDQVESGVE